MPNRPTIARVFTLAAAAALSLMLAGCDDATTAPPTSGTIAIDVQPDAVTAPWFLSGPVGYSHEGAGDATLTGLREGPYTVTWGIASGYSTPPNATQVVAGDATITFTGGYHVIGTVFPDTPDKMAANLMMMYETMNIAALAPLLHPDYEMFLQASTYLQYPSVGTTLDPVEERRIHERMFYRADVVDPDGALVPGVQVITFVTFARQGAWLESLANDLIPATPMAVYDVVILLDRGGTNPTMRVQGALKLYAAASDSLVDGVPRPYYRLRGVVDLTNDRKAAAGSEVSSWGLTKVLFR